MRVVSGTMFFQVKSTQILLPEIMVICGSPLDIWWGLWVFGGVFWRGGVVLGHFYLVHKGDEKLCSIHLGIGWK